MNVEDRLGLLAMLARFEGEDEWVDKVIARYPNGPTPNGPPWDRAELHAAWKKINSDRC